MDYSTGTIKVLTLVATILGLIQGSFWFLGSLFSILTYYDILHLNVDDESISYFIFKIITSGDDRTIIVFMFLYAVLSITVCVFSAILIKETFLAKSATQDLICYVSWSINIVILSLVDVVLTCFLGRDMSDLFYQSETPPLNLLNAYTIILVVSMRGIVFWIINIVLAGYITVFGFQVSHTLNSRSNDVINAFQESNGPWHTNLPNNPLARLSQKQSQNIKKTTTNSYQNLVGAENFTINSEIFRIQDNYEERLANIGVNEDQKINNDIQNIFDTISMQIRKIDTNSDPDYPYIPSPDYSPVGSPLLNGKSKKHPGRNDATKLTLF